LKGNTVGRIAAGAHAGRRRAESLVHISPDHTGERKLEEKRDSSKVVVFGKRK